ncbi:MAG: DUF6106 family protein [Acetivibrionales bacterium]|jgi:hypothetical protein
MDIFIEKLVTRKKTAGDIIIIAIIILMTVLLVFASLSIPVLYELNLGIVLAAGFAYLGYRLVISRNIEYEYIVTNGDLDIDKIISKSKRKRIFSANCREFDIVSKVKSDDFSRSLRGIKNKIDASGSIDSPDAYFITLNYKGEKTMVIFEPDRRMLDNFKVYIPRKVFAE